MLQLQTNEIRCSGLNRPMNCSGILFLKDLPEQETNAAAEEGTAAGELLAQMLLQRTLTPVVNPVASNGVRFDSDMYFHLNPIATEILQNAQTPVTCEERIDWQAGNGFWIRGQYDISYIRDNILYIDDLKYGWKIVEVKNNWQLLGYAIGRVTRLFGHQKDQLKGVMLRIHQPRPHHEDGTTREWFVTFEELEYYADLVRQRVSQVQQGKYEFVTGPQCKYCPAAGKDCPALNRAFYSSVDYILSDTKQDSMTEAEIAQQLQLMERVTEIMKIKEDSLKQLAVNRIKNGGIIPGYSTEQNFGDRKWKANVSPEVIEALTGKNIVEKTMLSPAKAEKVGVSRELVNNLVERHFLGMKLVKKDTSDLGDQIFGKGPSDAK